ncbi:putative nuclease HARBI1 [Procambarus clarkii]|uniref:putative nuclease HARBI1 n=1 Tax=Procambarus clarkii TaxID=6728 RepID=UPI001E67084B|nr:putative nuclease HARBI1 [Procambarus clarkii]
MARLIIANNEAPSEADRIRSLRAFHIRQGDNLFAMPEEQFLNMFRMSKAAVVTVLEELSYTSLANIDFPLHLQLLSTLAYYATGKAYDTMVILGATRRSAKLCIIRVSKALSTSLWERYLNFPDNQQIVNFKRDFRSVAEISELIGCMNSMEVAVKRNIGTEVGFTRLDYGRQFMKVLIVCGPHLQVTHIIVQNSCTDTDWEIFRESTLCSALEYGTYDSSLLLVDSSYPSQPYFQRPHDNPVTLAQDMFNLSHYVTHQITNEVFSLLKRRFPCLENTMEPIFPNNLCIPVACAILHNVCLRWASPMPANNFNRPPAENDNDLRQHFHQQYFVEE